jgi:Ca-activated chloride channel family protein
MRKWKRMLTLSAAALLTFCLAACSKSQTTASGVTNPENPNTNAIASGNTNAPTGSSIATAPHPPESAPRIIFILDASGSMLGKVGNEEKMAAARRVLKDSIGKLPDAAHVGLIAYGHRSASDCNDIETLSPLGPLDRTALAGQIDALKPRGKTPITNSLQKAFDVVRAQAAGGPVSVVLVTDGLETCAGDPCRLTRDARTAGLKFTMHVIGFDVGKVGVSQLECVAQAGDGLYLGAQNADELAMALAGAVTPKEIPAGRLAVGAVLDGKLTDVVVKVYRAGTKEEITNGRTYEAAETNPRVLPLAAGTYDIEAQAIKLADAPTRRFQNVKVVDGETVTRTANFGSGELAIGVTRNGKLSDAAIVVYVAGTSQEVASSRSYTAASSNPRVFRIEPGKYDVLLKSIEISGDPTVRLTDVVVDGGRQVKRTHDFSSGTLRIGAVRGGQLIDALVNVVGAENKSAASGRTYTNASSNPKAFELVPGRYRVRVSPIKPAGSRPQEIDIEIKPGQTVERTVDFSN